MDDIFTEKDLGNYLTLFFEAMIESSPEVLVALIKHVDDQVPISDEVGEILDGRNIRKNGVLGVEKRVVLRKKFFIDGDGNPAMFPDEEDSEV